MYRIVIAEDKPLIRKGIISVIDWDRLGCVLAGEASNGQEAIRLLRDLQPDILLTDIKMPYIDGLKLMDYIFENHMPTKVIAISGYDDFSYARHALSTDCVDYILKPINKKELDHALQRAIELIRTAPSSFSEASAKQSDLLADSVLKLQEAAFSELFEQANETVPYLLISFWNRYHDYAKAADHFQALLRDGITMTHALLPSVAVFVFQGLGADELCSFSPQGLEGYLGVSLTKAASDSVVEAYEESITALSHKFLQPEQRVFSYKPSAATFSDPQLPSFENLLLDALLLDDQAAATAIVRKACQEALQTESAPTLEGFRLLAIRLLSVVLKASNVCAAESNVLISTLSSHEQLIELESPEKIVRSLEQIVSKTCNEFQHQDSNNMGAITRYINLHFTESLSLAKLAEKFHFSQSYLSSLFKREMGIGFNKYITSLRMDYACQLLRSTSLLINEVSERAGYTDYIYFSKAFKAAIGVPPGEYRKTVINDSEQKP